MRGRVIFVSLAFFLLTASASAESHSPKPCEHFDGTPKTLDRCDKKEVSFTAKVSDFIMQHPTGVHARLDLKTGGLDRRHETYVDFGDPPSQIVLTSNEPIKCENSIQITGTVDLVPHPINIFTTKRLKSDEVLSGGAGTPGGRIRLSDL